VTEHVKSGRMKAYATTSANRLAAFPNLPTLVESGYPGIGSDNWNAIFAPVKTPRPVIDILFAAIIKSIQQPKVKESFTKANLPAVTSKSPEEALNFVKTDSLRWKRIIKENNISFE